jgi:hypothetical protein
MWSFRICLRVTVKGELVRFSFAKGGARPMCFMFTCRSAGRSPCETKSRKSASTEGTK